MHHCRLTLFAEKDICKKKTNYMILYDAAVVKQFVLATYVCMIRGCDLVSISVADILEVAPCDDFNSIFRKTF